MAVATDPAVSVLLTLRLKSFVDAEVVAHASRLPEGVVDELLARLADDGLVSFRDGRLQGWSLTTAGRIEGERRLAAELDRAGCRTLVRDAYTSFVALNARFLTACTRWQLRSEDGLQLVNEHLDPEYDAAVIAELDEIDDAVQPICHALAAAMERFAYYNGRFAVARVRVHAGEHDWFTAPMVDSYHSVWFELHENLLATLNLQRSTEAH
jgi:hypothetical protein